VGAAVPLSGAGSSEQAQLTNKGKAIANIKHKRLNLIIKKFLLKKLLSWNHNTRYTYLAKKRPIRQH
jgi:hypothetical protein